MNSSGGSGMEAPPAAVSVAALGVELAALVGGVVPELVPLAEAPGLWEEFSNVARLASGAALLLTRRVEESRVWAQSGHRTVEDFLAERSGVTVGDARGQLRAAGQLRGARDVEDAVRAGELSNDQAKAIADAAAVNPEAERRLVDDARKKTPLRELRERCQRAKAAADPDPVDRERRIHRDRGARWWTGSDGSFHFKAQGTVADGSRLVTALKPLIDDLYRTRRGTRQAASRDVYAFDALMGLADIATGSGGSGSGSGGGGLGRSPKVRHRAIIRVDHAALVRGWVEGDELCEISGLGPIPIRTARALLGESTLHLILTNGSDVANVTFLGRGPNAAQKVALAWSQPMCSNRACTGTWLQDDHREDWARTHETRLDGLDRLCPHCHRLKTYQGWALVIGTGRRELVPPTDPQHPRYRHPARGPNSDDDLDPLGGGDRLVTVSTADGQLFPLLE